jgi:hypothetical protein
MRSRWHLYLIFCFAREQRECWRADSWRSQGAIRVSAAAIMSPAGELNVLGPAVSRAGLREFAVASLSAACLTDNGKAGLW